MSQRKSAWLRAAVPAAVLALALTACGSDDEESEDTGLGDMEETEGTPGAEAEATPEETAEEPPAEEENGDDAAAGGGAEAVEPGAYEYALGDASDAVSFEDTSVLEITADRFQLGENADLADMDPADSEGMIPAHLYLNFELVGGDPLEFADPIYGTTTVNADGSYGTPVILIGTQIPGGCTDEETDSVDLAVGDTAELCTTVLIPEGTEPQQIVWSEGDYELTWSAN